MSSGRGEAHAGARLYAALLTPYAQRKTDREGERSSEKGGEGGKKERKLCRK